MIIQQISVFLENHVGQLADVTGVLADNHIDIQAVNIDESVDFGVARLIVDRPKKAMEVLRERGFVLRTTPVVQVLVPDRPGGLNELLNAVAGAGIDIRYMYSAFTDQKNGFAYMVFRVDDAVQLMAVLKDLA